MTIEQYFKSCYKMGWIDENRRDKKGEWIKDEKGNAKTFHKRTKVQIKPITLNGLALALDKEVLLMINSTDKDIINALTRIRKEYEERAIERCSDVDYKLYANLLENFK